MTMLKEHGGSERDIRDSMAVIEALSHADASVGWCAMIYLTTATACAALSPEWARTIVALGKPCAITAGAAQPRGRGKWVEGGMEVTGHWSWGSGIHHCDLICGGTVVEDDQADSKTYIVYFEPHQVKLYDNWNPSGLKGTGSVDFSVDRAFVPEGRWTVLGGSPRRSSGVLSRLPYFGMFASCVACVPLGIARRAIDDFCELARMKVSTGHASLSPNHPWYSSISDARRAWLHPLGSISLAPWVKSGKSCRRMRSSPSRMYVRCGSLRVRAQRAARAPWTLFITRLVVALPCRSIPCSATSETCIRRRSMPWWTGSSWVSRARRACWI